MRSAWIILLLFSFITLRAQEIHWENRIYSDDISTVLLSKNIDIYDPMPLVYLHSIKSLKLVFDQLQSTNEFFNYTLVHCDAEWNQSDMQQSEYLLGNPMGDIVDYSFSTNTYQQYVHYKLQFPQENMKISRSGNYILKVFRNFDETDLVLTRRFMVLDQQTKISTNIHPATLAQYRYSHQEVDFEVDYAGFDIPNPFQDVKVSILQNNCWENAVTGLQPLFVSNNELSFNYEDENLFQGGNEFRFFDIRSLRFFSNRVVQKYKDSLMNVVLKTDESRSHKAYLRWIDYNGKRVIANNDGTNIVEDGDYAVVHFSLQTGDKSDLGEVYVFGELSDWQFKQAFKMKYDSLNQRYTASVRLKQSYYNYLYVLKDKEGNMDYRFTEGTHRDTENDYTLLVYHKNVFYGYDELIGAVSRNSLTTQQD